MLIKSLGASEERDTPIWNAQMVMLAATEVGPDVTKISKFIGLPYAMVRPIVANLNKAGIFKRGKIRANWADENEGYLSFLLDSMVGAGLLERSPVRGSAS